MKQALAGEYRRRSGSGRRPLWRSGVTFTTLHREIGDSCTGRDRARILAQVLFYFIFQ